jgi:hypothetical protein
MESNGQIFPKIIISLQNLLIQTNPIVNRAIAAQRYCLNRIGDNRVRGSVALARKALSHRRNLPEGNKIARHE